MFEYEDGGRVSRVTVAFQSRDNMPPEIQSVEDHMALDNAHKLKQYPVGEVRSVSFPDDVTRHFRELKVVLRSPSRVSCAGLLRQRAGRPGSAPVASEAGKMYEALCEPYSRATWRSQGGTRYAALTANTLRGRAGCSATVVVKCRAVQVPFAVEIFESKTEGVSDTLVFAFETPGGFWFVLSASICIYVCGAGSMYVVLACCPYSVLKLPLLSGPLSVVHVEWCRLTAIYLCLCNLSKSLLPLVSFRVTCQDHRVARARRALHTRPRPFLPLSPDSSPHSSRASEP